MVVRAVSSSSIFFSTSDFADDQPSFELLARPATFVSTSVRCVVKDVCSAL